MNRRIDHLAAIAFVVLIGGGFLIDLSSYLKTGSGFPAESWTWKRIRRGDTARKVESWAEDRSAVGRWVRPRFSELAFRAIGAPNPKVVAGPDMLFLKQNLELEDEPFWDRAAKRAGAWAARLQACLRPWGGRLVLVFVPSRIRIHADQLPELAFDDSARRPAYRRMIDSVRAAGVTAVDLEAHYLEQRGGKRSESRIYYRGDHHWTEHGARLAAAEIVGAIGRLTSRPFDEPLDLRLQSIRRPELVGSILNATGWARDSETARRFGDDFSYVVGTRSSDGERYRASWNAPIHLAADSFGRQQISAILARRLGVPAADFVRAGKGGVYGPSLAMEAIRRGARPEVLVVIAEEAAIAREQGRALTGWRWGISSAGTDSRLAAIALDDVTTGRGAEEISRSRGILRIENVKKYFRIRVRRSAIPGNRLIFYLRCSRSIRRATYLGTFDGKSPGESVVPHRMMVHDAADPGWQRFDLAVPEGDGDIDIRVRSALTGRWFEFRDFASEVDEAEFATTGWRPENIRISRPGPPHRPWDAVGKPQRVRSDQLLCSIDRTRRITTNAGLDAAEASLPFSFRAVAADGFEGSAVVTISVVDEDRGREIRCAQQEIRFGATKTVHDVVVSVPAGSSAVKRRLQCDVVVPAEHEGKVRIDVHMPR